MSDPVNAQALDILFRKARTHNSWLNKPVSDDTLHQLYDLMKWGPTSANTCPARIVFVKSKEAKEKLLPCMAAGNVEKTKAAPVTAIIAYDMEFYEKLPRLFPHTDARSWFAGNGPLIESTAFRNGTLQGAIQLAPDGAPRAFAQALLFGPQGDLFVPMTSGDSVRRYSAGTR